MRSAISNGAYLRALVLRDLTDRAYGGHSMQLLIEQVTAALSERWRCQMLVNRGSRAVSEEDNYDLLGYPNDAATRGSRYTRYLKDGRLLRTHTSAVIPSTLRLIAKTSPADILLVCPGLVYRRDVIDRLHVGEPHQLDLWRILERPTSTRDLGEMVEIVVSALLPGKRYRTIQTAHPYTLAGLEVEAEIDARWVEVLECGLAHPDVLYRCGLDSRRYRGLAMGIGLDRMLMLRKGIADIRLLRSQDPRVATQMLNLEPYHEVSGMPPVKRDISVAVEQAIGEEEIGELVREALGSGSASVESIEVLSSTPYPELPPPAIKRLGMQPDQKNLLIRLVIRDLDRTLSDTEANIIRDQIYEAIHQGNVHQWATR